MRFSLQLRVRVAVFAALSALAPSRSRAAGSPLPAALIEAGAARFKPIFLTAATAAMIGVAFILADHTYQGLAIALAFGIACSATPAPLVIPAIYVAPRDDEETPKTQNKEMKTWFKIGRN